MARTRTATPPLDRMRFASRRAAQTLVAVAALVAVTGAHADKIAFTAADQKTAHAIVLKAADLGPGWHGGARRPELTGPRLYCSNLRQHKQPPLVATGAAETELSSELVGLTSEAEVVRDAGMVAADFRFDMQPGLVGCVRRVAARLYGAKAKLLSIARIAVPRLTPLTGGFRSVLSIPYGGQWVSVEVDQLFVGKGRTELTLTTSTAPTDVARTRVRSVELRLLRLMVSRTPSS